MSFIGKLHEVSMYGMITTFVSLIWGKTTISSLWYAAFHPNSFTNFFLAYLFWATVLFVPIALAGALYTKYADYGEGLTFHSNNLGVIFFAHIGEELLGLFLTPIWFLKDLITRNWDDWKVVDYILYAVELIFIAIGIIVLWSM